MTVSDIWLAYFDGVALCGTLICATTTLVSVRTLYQGNSRLTDAATAKLNSSVNRFLHWQTMLHYRSEGLAFYDWGGIGNGTGPIAQFKLSMGGEPREDHTYVIAGWFGKQAFRLFKLLR